MEYLLLATILIVLYFAYWKKVKSSVMKFREENQITSITQLVKPREVKRITTLIYKKYKF